MPPSCLSVQINEGGVKDGLCGGSIQQTDGAEVKKKHEHHLGAVVLQLPV